MVVSFNKFIATDTSPYCQAILCVLEAFRIRRDSHAMPIVVPPFRMRAIYELRAVQRRDAAPGTRDPNSDPPAKKSVSTSVKGVCFAEKKGAG